MAVPGTFADSTSAVLNMGEDQDTCRYEVEFSFDVAVDGDDGFDPAAWERPEFR